MLNKETFNRINEAGNSLKSIIGMFETMAFDFDTTVEKKDSTIEINIPVPGFKKEEIEISVEEGIMTVKGTTKTPSSFKKSFAKSYELPPNVDQERISARQEDGVLTISLNKVDKKKASSFRVDIR